MNNPPLLVPREHEGGRPVTTGMPVPCSSSCIMEDHSVHERRRTRKIMLPGGTSMFRCPSFRRKAKEPKGGSEASRLPTMTNTQQARPHSMDTAVPMAGTTNLTHGVVTSSNNNNKSSLAMVTMQPPREAPRRRDILAGILETAIPIEAAASPSRYSSWSRRESRTTSLYPDVTSSVLMLEQGHHASFGIPLCTAHLVSGTPVYAGHAHPVNTCSSVVPVPATRTAATTATNRSPCMHATASVATVTINEGSQNDDEKSTMTTFDRFFQHRTWNDTSIQQQLDEEKEIQDIVISSANQVWDEYVRKRQKDTRERLPFLTPEIIEQQRQTDRKVQQTIFNVANEAWEKTLLQNCSQHPKQDSNNTQQRK